MNTMFLKKLDGLIGPFFIKLWSKPSRCETCADPVSSILIIRPGGIGDAVLLTPLIKRLRGKFPAARIDILAERRNFGVFNLCTGIDRVFRYDKPRELLTVIRGQYDLVIDSEQWYRLSALVARTVRSQRSIGYATNERKKLFTCPVEYNPDEYEKKVFLDLLKPLALDPTEDATDCFLSVPDETQASVDAILGPLAKRPFIALFAGASIPEKNWGVDKFRELLLRLIAAGYPVVVVGGKEDVSDGELIACEEGAINLAGRTSLAGTAAILKRSMLLISGDSGVLHLAVGLGKATVSIFGPSNSCKWAPRGDRHVVINQFLPCSPCSHYGIMPPCPIMAKCIREVTVDEVFKGVQNLLNAKTGAVDSDVV